MAVRKHPGLTSNACVTWPHGLKLPFTINNSWALLCSSSHRSTIFPSTASQTAHTCLSPKPKHHSGTNHTAILCWAANPNMARRLWATSQTMKSHSTIHTPCPLGSSLYNPLHYSPYPVGVSDPKLLTSHYTVLPGSVNHSTAPMWNTKVDICGINECTCVFIFSSVYRTVQKWIQEKLNRLCLPSATYTPLQLAFLLLSRLFVLLRCLSQDTLWLAFNLL